MAHLVISPLATTLWEAISSNVLEAQRPAFLDQTDGVAHSRSANYEALVAVAETVKEDLDMTNFTLDRLGTDSLAAVKHITAATASFKDGVELQSLFTTYVNLHDTLIANLACSGYSKELGTLERRMDCFANFVGGRGRSKNIGLFYCFIVWEGKPTRWTTRRLDPSLGVSSASDESSSRIRALPAQTKKQVATNELIKNLREAFTPASSSNNSSSSRGTEAVSITEVDELLTEKKRLFDAKSNTERQSKRTMRWEQLQSVISSKGFDLLPADRQRKLLADWDASLSEEDWTLRSQ